MVADRGTLREMSALEFGATLADDRRKAQELPNIKPLTLAGNAGIWLCK